MRTGAFVMIDALGFKGIWKRQGVVDKPELVIEKLINLKDIAAQYLDKRFGGQEKRSQMENDRGTPFELVQATFLSDTIVLAVAVKDLENTQLNELHLTGPNYTLASKVLAVDTLCDLTSKVVALGALTDPALAYRGCLSFGQFEVRENFLVGPAVDEAAAASELAQGAFIWMLPSALDLFMSYGVQKETHLRPDRTFSAWQVPLKGGDCFNTFAVSPLSLARTEAERDLIHTRIMETFSGELDVQIKKQHTLRFLDTCVAEWKSPLPGDGR